MAFVEAMDAETTTKMRLGENGSAEYTADGVGDARVALFAGMVRKAPNVDALFNGVLTLAKRTNDQQVWVDLVLLLIHTRDCRGGKGERELFYCLYFLLCSEVPELALELLQLVPEYGYWKDLCTLYEQVESQPSAVRREADRVRAAILKLMSTQLLLDIHIDDAKHLSLCAKYAPREGKKFDTMAKALAQELFRGEVNCKQKYRQLLVSLNSKLSTTEIKMCGKRWREIHVSAVPSLCMAKSRKAFLNEKLERSTPLTGALAMSGDRYPHDVDRVACRQNLRKAVLDDKKMLKGGQLFPHELVKTILNQRRATSSTLEDDVIDAQWQSLIENVRASLNQEKKEDHVQEKTGNEKNAKLDLGRLVALVDVSGSMSGQPMEVAIALGLVVSELAAPAFQNRVLTFESTPRWHTIDPGHNLSEKVRALQRAPWGGSTDFAAALELILNACVEHSLEPEDIPDLIVFSDMQFNSAHRSTSPWETHYERFIRLFAETGLAAIGKPWSPPTITFWNLRAPRSGAAFMAQSDQAGVRLLSGFSSSLLKLVLYGDSLEDDSEVVLVDERGNTTVTKTNRPTPYTTMRKALDDARYDRVRLLLSASKQAEFVNYRFQPQESTDDDNDLVLVNDDATTTTDA